MIKIYGYQLSQATMRIRIALNVKGVSFDETYLDLVKGDQFDPAYRAVNPQQVVPAVIMDDGGPTLFQSMAILEYIEETYPEPALLPADARGRARVRGLAQIIVADTHRAVVPTTRNYISQTLGLGEVELMAWIRYWVGAGLQAFEANLTGSSEQGQFCHGDTPTFADLCLVPQIFGAKRFDVPLDDYPTALSIFGRCLEIEAFARAAPANLPDAR